MIPTEVIVARMTMGKVTVTHMRVIVMIIMDIVMDMLSNRQNRCQVELLSLVSINILLVAVMVMITTIIITINSKSI